MILPIKPSACKETALLTATIHRLSPSDDPNGKKPGHGLVPGGIPAEAEDLPYKVELWDDKKQAIEQVLAITASGSIGYAAYFAATKEYNQRYITLRHRNAIINRWNPPAH